MYFKKLRHDTQKLLYSIFLFNLIGPMLGLFINAFLWRQSHDVTLIAFYNLIIFIIIPVGFYLNGLLLKKFSPGRLYFFSLAILGIAVASLIFLTNISYSIILIFGIVDGLSS